MGSCIEITIIHVQRDKNNFKQPFLVRSMGPLSISPYTETDRFHTNYSGSETTQP